MSIETPEELRARLAFGWIWTNGSLYSPRPFSFVRADGWAARYEDMTDEDLALASLWPLAAPIAALQTYGFPEEWDVRAEAIRAALDGVRLPTSLERSPRFGSLQSGGTALFDCTRQYAYALRLAQKSLEDEGWRLNRETRRGERMNAGNRPFGLRRKLTLTIARSIRAGALVNDQALRDEIAYFLQWWLAPSEADPAKDGPIDRDLKNELRKQARG